MNEQPPLTPTTSTCGLAITSLVLGILSLTCFGLLTGIPALITGAVAMNRIKKSAGRQTGEGLAIAGLCTGGVGMVVGTAILAGLLLPAVAGAREKARRVVCTGNERQIVLAYGQYQAENNGKAPASLDDLRKYLGDGKVLHCPADADQNQPSYELVPEAKPGGIILRERRRNHRGGSVVGYVDGRVVFTADAQEGP